MILIENEKKTRYFNMEQMKVNFDTDEKIEYFDRCR